MHRFSRFTKVIGDDAQKSLIDKCVLILGCGGVGGYVVEALARCGIGKLILVDFDTIDETNINRQIIALNSTVGKKKIDVLCDRVKDINNQCCVICNDNFIDSNNLDKLFDFSIDYFIDACDTVSTKKEVIRKCLEKRVSFISCMGTGNKIDPSKLEIVDIRKTSGDPLARIMRKFVKDEKITKKVMVLSSTEVPVKTGDRNPGSTAFVPASAGLLIASYVVRDMIKKNN